MIWAFFGCCEKFGYTSAPGKNLAKRCDKCQQTVCSLFTIGMSVGIPRVTLHEDRSTTEIHTSDSHVQMVRLLVGCKNKGLSVKRMQGLACLQQR